MAGAGNSDGRMPAGVPALVGLVTTAAVGVAMWRSASPWTLTLDAGTSFLGQTVPAFRTWFAGRVPEWSDLLWGGFPVLAEPTTAALYPPHAIAYLATLGAPLRFFDVALALHVGLLAAGSALLLRELGAGVIAAVLAGVLAVLSPIGHGNAIANFASFGALAWLPWVLVAAERLARPSTPLVGGAMLLGWIALAGQVLVGMPEHAVYAGILAAVWIGVRRSGLGVGARAARIVVLALGALATSAPQILTTLAYMPATTRSGAAPAAELGSLWISKPLGLLVPGTMSGVTCFLGAAALVLVGLAVAARRGGAPILLGIAVVTLALALGPQVGLYAWLHSIPPFDRFRAPVKLYGLTEYAFVWAAMLGLDVLLRAPSPRRRRMAAALGLLAVLERVLFLAWDERAFLPGMYRDAPKANVVDLLAGTRMLGARLPGQPPPLVLDMGGPLGGGYAGSLGALVGVASLHAGGVSLLPRPHAELLYGPLRPHALTLFGVRYAVVPTNRCPPISRRLGWVQATATPDFCVLLNPQPTSPFAGLDRATAVDSMDAMITAVRTARTDPVPVVGPPALAADLGPARVIVEAYEPGRIRLNTTSVTRTLLLARQSLVPGWTALADGVPAPIHPAAGLYFAVPLAPGPHTVTLTYRAAGFRPGLALTTAWWLTVASALAWRRRRPVSR